MKIIEILNILEMKIKEINNLIKVLINKKVILKLISLIIKVIIKKIIKKENMRKI